MTQQTTLVDSGPLVALLHLDDEYHERCVETLRALRGRLVTVWPVFTEAMYLLGFSWTAQDALFEMAQSGAVGLLALDASDVARMHELMRKYRDFPMDLADAALVAAAEREKIRDVFTLDRRHFLAYRPIGVRAFAIVP
jgi:predicted nucleic acid-binding protein